MKTAPWIEAMRPRTLPVSAAGVIVAAGYGVMFQCIKWLPALLCLIFALLAQIASNFANEYYDYRAGLDKPGRVGPRRGVTEGDITPEAMKRATFLTLGVASLIGLSLIYWGGWWLIAAGVAIAIGALAYSAGPYPLSRHALGELTVILFFGVVPVNLTFYIFNGGFDLSVACGSVAVGLMSANILLVNNYRDADDDREVGKHTLATKFGRATASTLYLIFGYAAIALFAPLFIELPVIFWVIPTLYLLIHTTLWIAILRVNGSRLNPMLGLTACNLLLFSLLFLFFSFVR